MNTLLLCAWLTAAGPAQPPALLACDRPRIDRGEVRGGPPLVQRFSLSNRGPLPLALAAARGSCGCLEPRLSRQTLDPGETAELELEVNTLTQPPGPHCWHVRVGYAPVLAGVPDPSAGGDLELELRARLTGELTVSPASLHLLVGSGVTSSLTLTDRRPAPLNVTAVRTTDAGLRAEFEGPWRSENGAWVRRVHLAAGGGPAGHHDCLVLLDSDDPEYRTLKVPVALERRPTAGVTATPAAVHFAAPARGATPSALVYLRDAGGRAVRVEGVDCDAAGVACGWADGPDAWSTLKVRLTGDRPSAPATIRVRLREPAGETVTIPVSADGP
jgi:hypothetical protein